MSISLNVIPYLSPGYIKDVFSGMRDILKKCCCFNKSEYFKTGNVYKPGSTKFRVGRSMFKVFINFFLCNCLVVNY